jgi:hypothetical protein
VTDPELPRTTPEGHTPEQPRPSELGKPGSPGAGMTTEVPHAADARAVEAGGEHAEGEPLGDAHAALGDDDHAHAEPKLGPIDWPAWASAAAGVAVALAVVALFYVAIT